MLYKHYKGGYYERLYEAIHTETGEELIIYSSYQDGKIYARPKEVFDGEVKLEDGSIVKRFEETS